jgi:hypothetical protein
MKAMRNAYKTSLRKPEEKRPLRRPWHRLEDIKLHLKEIVCRHHLSGSGHGPLSGSCKHSNKTLGFIGREFLDQLSDYYLFKKDSYSKKLS